MKYLDVPYFKQDTNYTCGPTALQMVLAYYDIRESEASLAEKLGTDSDNGTRRVKMRELAVSYGLHCYVNDNAPFEELSFFIATDVPVIIRFLETGKGEDHYGVVIGANEHSVVIHDPWHGERVHFDRADFLPRWTCDIIGDCHQWLMAVSKDPLPLGHQY